MKFFVAIILIAFSFTLPRAQTTVPTDEGTRLSVEVVRLFGESKYVEALPVAKNAIAVREKNLGREHILVGQSLRNLAYIELKLNNRKDASNSFERAVEIYESNEPLAKSDQAGLAEMFETMAYINIVNGNADKSVSKLQQAIALREKVNGVDALETASPLKTLGQVFNGIGDYEKAVPLLIRALEIRSKAEGIDNLLLRQTTACSLTKLGRNDEAAEINRKYRSNVKDETSTAQARTVSGGVLNGMATSLPKPPYPAEAKVSRAGGSVSIQVLIDETGKVIFACAVSGPKILQPGTESAAYQATFTPTLLEGKPVRVSGVITYNFVP